MGTQNWDGLALDGRDSISGYRLTRSRTLAHEGNIFQVTGAALGGINVPNKRIVKSALWARKLNSHRERSHSRQNRA
jgi:hypothetical protein